MANEVFQTRLADDVASHAHAYKDERGIDKSEATRRLVRAGLEAEKDDEPARTLPDEIRFGAITAALVTAPVPILAIEYVLIPLAYLAAAVAIQVGQTRGSAAVVREGSA